ncbi:hypothetical protein ABZ319_13145, partial [Nocardia sp. NPDC005978]
MIYLPSELEWLGWIVGMEWPDGNEDQMWNLAQDWHTAADGLRGLLDEVSDARYATLASYPDGKGSEEMAKVFDLLSGKTDADDSTSIPDLAKYFDSIGDSAHDTGTEIEYTKLMFYSSLGLLAAELIAAWVFPPTAPAVEAAAIAFTRVAVRIIGARAVAAIARFAAKMAGSALAKFLLRHVAIDFTLGTVQEIGIQQYQVSKGSRKEINWTQVGVTAISSAAGGAAAGPFGGWLGDNLARRGLDGIGGAGLASIGAGLAGAGAGFVAATGAQFGFDVAQHGWDQAVENLSNTQFDWRMLSAGATNGAMSGMNHHAAHNFWNSRGGDGSSDPPPAPPAPNVDPPAPGVDPAAPGVDPAAPGVDPAAPGQDPSTRPTTDGQDPSTRPTTDGQDNRANPDVNEPTRGEDRTRPGGHNTDDLRGAPATSESNAPRASTPDSPATTPTVNTAAGPTAAPAPSTAPVTSAPHAAPTTSAPGSSAPGSSAPGSSSQPSSAPQSSAPRADAPSNPGAATDSRADIDGSSAHPDSPPETQDASRASAPDAADAHAAAADPSAETPRASVSDAPTSPTAEVSAAPSDAPPTHPADTADHSARTPEWADFPTSTPFETPDAPTSHLDAPVSPAGDQVPATSPVPTTSPATATAPPTTAPPSTAPTSPNTPGDHRAPAPPARPDVAPRPDLNAATRPDVTTPLADTAPRAHAAPGPGEAPRAAADTTPPRADLAPEPGTAPRVDSDLASRADLNPVDGPESRPAVDPVADPAAVGRHDAEPAARPDPSLRADPAPGTDANPSADSDSASRTESPPRADDTVQPDDPGADRTSEPESRSSAEESSAARPDAPRTTGDGAPIRDADPAGTIRAVENAVGATDSVASRTVGDDRAGSPLGDDPGSVPRVDNVIPFPVDAPAPAAHEPRSRPAPAAARRSGGEPIGDGGPDRAGDGGAPRDADARPPTDEEVASALYGGDEPPVDDWSNLTPDEISERLRTLHGIETFGFDNPNVHPEVLCEFARAVDDVVSRYGEIDLREVSVQSMDDPDNYAEAWSAWGSDGSIVTQRLVLNDTWMTTPERFANAVSEDEAAGDLVPNSAARPVFSTVVHELGHALDFAGNLDARDRALDALVDHYEDTYNVQNWTDAENARFQEWLHQLSDYGFDYSDNFDATEALAEAFTDVELNGDDASEPARVLYNLLTDIAADATSGRDPDAARPEVISPGDESPPRGRTPDSGDESGKPGDDSPGKPGGDDSAAKPDADAPADKPDAPADKPDAPADKPDAETPADKPTADDPNSRPDSADTQEIPLPTTAEALERANAVISESEARLAEMQRRIDEGFAGLDRLVERGMDAATRGEEPNVADALDRAGDVLDESANRLAEMQRRIDDGLAELERTINEGFARTPESTGDQRNPNGSFQRPDADTAPDRHDESAHPADRRAEDGSWQRPDAPGDRRAEDGSWQRPDADAPGDRRNADGSWQRPDTETPVAERNQDGSWQRPGDPPGMLRDTDGKWRPDARNPDGSWQSPGSDATRPDIPVSEATRTDTTRPDIPVAPATRPDIPLDATRPDAPPTRQDLPTQSTRADATRPDLPAADATRTDITRQNTLPLDVRPDLPTAPLPVRPEAPRLIERLRQIRDEIRELLRQHAEILRHPSGSQNDSFGASFLWEGLTTIFGGKPNLDGSDGIIRVLKEVIELYKKRGRIAEFFKGFKANRADDFTVPVNEDGTPNRYWENEVDPSLADQVDIPEHLRRHWADLDSRLPEPSSPDATQDLLDPRERAQRRVDMVDELEDLARRYVEENERVPFSDQLPLDGKGRVTEDPGQRYLRELRGDAANILDHPGVNNGMEGAPLDGPLGDQFREAGRRRAELVEDLGILADYFDLTFADLTNDLEGTITRLRAEALLEQLRAERLFAPQPTLPDATPPFGTPLPPPGPPPSSPETRTDTTRPDGFDPAPTRPDAVDADLTRPDGLDPNATRPDGLDPNATRPDGLDPNATRPDGLDLNATRPDGLDPNATRPDGLDPNVTRPDGLDPNATRPDGLDPTATRPDGLDPNTTRPDGLEPPARRQSPDDDPDGPEFFDGSDWGSDPGPGGDSPAPQHAQPEAGPVHTDATTHTSDADDAANSPGSATPEPDWSPRPDDDWSTRDRWEIADRLTEILSDRRTDGVPIQVLGFDNEHVPTEVLREYARAIADMLARHPSVDLRGISIEPLSDIDTYAQAFPVVDESGRVYTERLALGLRYAIFPEEFQTSLAADEATRFMAPGSGDRPVYSTILHEFGHALDFEGQMRARELAFGALSDAYDRLTGRSDLTGFGPWLSEGLSGYSFRDGVFNPTEALAEAFTDVESNGDRASEPARALYQAMLDAAAESAPNPRLRADDDSDAPPRHDTADPDPDAAVRPAPGSESATRLDPDADPSNRPERSADVRPESARRPDDQPPQTPDSPSRSPLPDEPGQHRSSAPASENREPRVESAPAQRDTGDDGETTRADPDSSVPAREAPDWSPRPDDEWSPLDRDQIADELAERWDVDVFGFDNPNIDPEVLREFARAVDEMFTRYPDTDLNAIAIMPLEEGTLGEAWPKIEDGEHYTDRLVLNEQYAGNPQDFARRVRESEEAGHLVAGSADRPIYSTVVHEFAHAIDFSGQMHGRTEAFNALMEHYLETRGDLDGFVDWLKAQLSGYSFAEDGTFDRAEAMAEALTDVVLNGPAAGPAAHVLHRVLVDAAADYIAQRDLADSAEPVEIPGDKGESGPKQGFNADGTLLPPEPVTPHGFNPDGTLRPPDAADPVVRPGYDPDGNSTAPRRAFGDDGAPTDPGRSDGTDPGRGEPEAGSPRPESADEAAAAPGSDGWFERMQQDQADWLARMEAEREAWLAGFDHPETDSETAPPETSAAGDGQPPNDGPPTRRAADDDDPDAWFDRMQREHDAWLARMDAERAEWLAGFDLPESSATTPDTPPITPETAPAGPGEPPDAGPPLRPASDPNDPDAWFDRMRADQADWLARMDAQRAEWLHRIADEYTPGSPEEWAARFRADAATWDAQISADRADWLWDMAGGRPDLPAPGAIPPPESAPAATSPDLAPSPGPATTPDPATTSGPATIPDGYTPTVPDLPAAPTSGDPATTGHDPGSGYTPTLPDIPIPPGIHEAETQPIPVGEQPTGDTPAPAPVNPMLASPALRALAEHLLQPGVRGPASTRTPEQQAYADRLAHTLGLRQALAGHPDSLAAFRDIAEMARARGLFGDPENGVPPTPMGPDDFRPLTPDERYAGEQYWRTEADPEQRAAIEAEIRAAGLEDRLARAAAEEDAAVLPPATGESRPALSPARPDDPSTTRPDNSAVTRPENLSSTPHPDPQSALTRPDAPTNRPTEPQSEPRVVTLPELRAEIAARLNLSEADLTPARMSELAGDLQFQNVLRAGAIEALADAVQRHDAATDPADRADHARTRDDWARRLNVDPDALATDSARVLDELRAETYRRAADVADLLAITHHTPDPADGTRIVLEADGERIHVRITDGPDGRVVEQVPRPGLPPEPTTSNAVERRQRPGFFRRQWERLKAGFPVFTPKYPSGSGQDGQVQVQLAVELGHLVDSTLLMGIESGFNPIRLWKELATQWQVRERLPLLNQLTARTAAISPDALPMHTRQGDLYEPWFTEADPVLRAEVEESLRMAGLPVGEEQLENVPYQQSPAERPEIPEPPPHHWSPELPQPVTDAVDARDAALTDLLRMARDQGIDLSAIDPATLHRAVDAATYELMRRAGAIEGLRDAATRYNTQDGEVPYTREINFSDNDPLGRYLREVRAANEAILADERAEAARARARTPLEADYLEYKARRPRPTFLDAVGVNNGGEPARDFDNAEEELSSERSGGLFETALMRDQIRDERSNWAQLLAVSLDELTADRLAHTIGDMRMEVRDGADRLADFADAVDNFLRLDQDARDQAILLGEGTSRDWVHANGGVMIDRGVGLLPGEPGGPQRLVVIRGDIDHDARLADALAVHPHLGDMLNRVELQLDYRRVGFDEDGRLRVIDMAPPQVRFHDVESAGDRLPLTLLRDGAEPWRIVQGAVPEPDAPVHSDPDTAPAPPRDPDVVREERNEVAARLSVYQMDLGPEFLRDTIDNLRHDNALRAAQIEGMVDFIRTSDAIDNFHDLDRHLANLANRLNLDPTQLTAQGLAEAMADPSVRAVRRLQAVEDLLNYAKVLRDGADSAAVLAARDELARRLGVEPEDLYASKHVKDEVNGEVVAYRPDPKSVKPGSLLEAINDLLYRSGERPELLAALTDYIDTLGKLDPYRENMRYDPSTDPRAADGELPIHDPKAPALLRALMNELIGEPPVSDNPSGAASVWSRLLGVDLSDNAAIAKIYEKRMVDLHDRLSPRQFADVLDTLRARDMDAAYDAYTDSATEGQRLLTPDQLAEVVQRLQDARYSDVYDLYRDGKIDKHERLEPAKFAEQIESLRREIREREADIDLLERLAAEHGALTGTPEPAAPPRDSRDVAADLARARRDLEQARADLDYARDRLPLRQDRPLADADLSPERLPGTIDYLNTRSEQEIGAPAVSDRRIADLHDAAQQFHRAEDGVARLEDAMRDALLRESGPDESPVDAWRREVDSARTELEAALDDLPGNRPVDPERAAEMIERLNRIPLDQTDVWTDELLAVRDAADRYTQAQDFLSRAEADQLDAVHAAESPADTARRELTTARLDLLSAEAQRDAALIGHPESAADLTRDWVADTREALSGNDPRTLPPADRARLDLAEAAARHHDAEDRVARWEAEQSRLASQAAAADLGPHTAAARARDAAEADLHQAISDFRRHTGLNVAPADLTPTRLIPTLDDLASQTIRGVTPHSFDAFTTLRDAAEAHHRAAAFADWLASNLPDPASNPPPAEAATTPDPAEAATTPDQPAAVTIPDQPAAVTTPDQPAAVTTSDPVKAATTEDPTRGITPPENPDSPHLPDPGDDPDPGDSGPTPAKPDGPAHPPTTPASSATLPTPEPPTRPVPLTSGQSPDPSVHPAAEPPATPPPPSHPPRPVAPPMPSEPPRPIGPPMPNHPPMPVEPPRPAHPPRPSEPPRPVAPPMPSEPPRPIGP